MEIELDFDLFSDNNPNNSERLKERFKRVISENADAFVGKTIIDIAANNNRWTYAALAAGASKIFSIEGRQERADLGKEFLHTLGYEGKYEATVGDMYDYLHDFDRAPIDTVMCLGIYYHIMDHYHLLKLIARLAPQTIIIDSGFLRSFRNQIHVQMEDPDQHLNALSVYEGQTNEPVGFVSLGLMMQMAWNLGYSCKPMLWDPKTIARPKVVQDYMMGLRYTLRLDKIEGHNDADWTKDWEGVLAALNPEFVKLLNPETHDSVVDARCRSRLSSAQFSVF